MDDRELIELLDGTNCRVADDIDVPTELWGDWQDSGQSAQQVWTLYSCWLNYVHQKSWFNYPAISGLDFHLGGGLRNGTFDYAQYQAVFELHPGGAAAKVR